MLIFKSIESGVSLFISNFYSELPPEAEKDNQKAVARYVADKFGEAEGFSFLFDKQYTISQRANNLHSEFSGATVVLFKCS